MTWTFVSVSADNVRDIINITPEEIPDNKIFKIIKRAEVTLELETNKTVDYTDCSDAKKISSHSRLYHLPPNRQLSRRIKLLSRRAEHQHPQQSPTLWDSAYWILPYSGEAEGGQPLGEYETPYSAEGRPPNHLRNLRPSLQPHSHRHDWEDTSSKILRPRKTLVN